MPAVTEQHQETIHHSASKKRRRDDDDDGHQQSNTPSYEAFFWKETPLDHHRTNAHPHSATEQQSHNAFASYASPHHHLLRKHIPLPTPKRLKETIGEDAVIVRETRSLSPNPQNLKSPQREPQETSPDTRPAPTRHASAPAPLLSRCHICHRKPTRKADLDSFGSCEGCGQRTCFVCLRECLDWRTEEQKRWNGYGSASFNMRDAADVGVAGQEEDSLRRLKGLLQRGDGEQLEGLGGRDGWAIGGHRMKICSRCCVERGPDGDVVCLGCLPFVEG